MSNQTPVSIERSAMNFRMFLRNNYYPQRAKEIEQSIYNNIPNVQEIVDPGVNDFRVKCKSKKSITLLDYSNSVQNMVLDICLNYDLIQFLLNQQIDEKEKNELIYVYRDLEARRTTSYYIAMMYNARIFHLAIPSIILIITL